MRTREEIEEDKEWKMYRNGEVDTSGGTPVDELILETLLDIRDLLANKEK